MKVMLRRCDNDDIAYVQDVFGNLIGFNEKYEDSDGNKYIVYYKCILESNDAWEQIENDCWENVADWYEPTDIEYYVEEDGTIAKAIAKKANGKHIGYGDSLLDIGCSVTVSTVGTMLILTI